MRVNKVLCAIFRLMIIVEAIIIFGVLIDPDRTEAFLPATGHLASIHSGGIGNEESFCVSALGNTPQKARQLSQKISAAIRDDLAGMERFHPELS